MRRDVRSTLEMSLRVREFSRAHPLTDPVAAAAVAKFEERLTATEEASARQDGSRSAARAANARKLAVKERPLHPLLKHVARVAEAAAADHPELSGKFRAPNPAVTGAVFRAQAATILELARTNKEILAKYGLTPAMAADLEQSFALLDQVSDESRTTTRERIAAGQLLVVLRSDLLESVKILSGLYRYEFREDPSRLAEWESVSEERRHRGKKDETPPTEGGKAA